MKRLLLVVLLPVLALSSVGCASKPGVVPIGPDTYLVSRQAATGFTGMSGLMEAAMLEGNDFCGRKGLVFQVVNTSQSQPPYILGNFPKASVQFMCLSSKDPELARPKLQPSPDIVIGTTHPSAPAAPLNAPPAETVPVAINAEPEGADVYVDGAFVGNAPLPDFRLVPGQHSIEIKRAGFTAWKRTITVVAGTPTNVRATLDREH